MNSELWSWRDLITASGGIADGEPPGIITGFSLDTRTLAQGEIFVALKDQRDGHEFVSVAFAKGAAAALVSDSYTKQTGDGTLLRVPQPQAALEAIGRASRARTQARIVAVTGSAGKTSTKEALRACLSRLGPVHAAEKSYNNHWGVPLTLARMPATSRFGVFEIGMNHAGEITPLTRMVRPHVAIITNVEPVHLQYFPSVEAIAEAKAEIFAGLEPGGTAVLNRDNRHYELLERRARDHGAKIMSFGRHAAADVRLGVLDTGPDSSGVVAHIRDRKIAYRLGAPGAHLAQNSLAVIAALDVLGADLDVALLALAEVSAAEGRGSRVILDIPGGRALLIDESYNANPASMRSALAAMATVPRSAFGRRIAVLGDMLELGSGSAGLHADLYGPVEDAQVDLLFACGPNMRHLFDRAHKTQRGAWSETSDGIVQTLLETVRAGDVVMIKGSLGSRMSPLVAALKARAVMEHGAR